MQYLEAQVVPDSSPTNSFLYLRTIKDTPLCTFGCNEEEKLTHLFYQCPKVRFFWNTMIDWLKTNCTNCDLLFFSEELIVFGLKKNIVTDKVIDLLILIGKWHIYKCKLQDREPTIDIFKQQFKQRYTIEKSISIAGQKYNSFKDTWHPYQNLIK